MYSSGTELLKRNEELVSKIITHDRERYRWCYETIFEFISTRDIMLGSDAAIDFYSIDATETIEKIIENNSQIVLYSENVYQDACKLSDFMFKNSGLKSIFVKPVWQDIEYDIMVSSRKICKFVVLEPYKTVNIFKLISPELKKIKIKDAELEIKLISPEILLIDIYRRLILLEYFDEREKLVHLEKKLFDYYFKKRKQAKVNKEIHGESEWTKLEKFNYSSSFIVDFKVFLLNCFKIIDKNILVVGRQAIDPENNLELLEICSSLTQNQIEEVLSAAIENFKTTNKQYANTGKINLVMDHYKYRINVPIDIRLRRVRINLILTDGVSSNPDSAKKIKIQLLDIFNATQYDLIVDHPYTYLRFMFVDMWTLELLTQHHDITEDVYKKNLTRFMRWIEMARKAVDLPQNVKKYNNLSAYIGVYDSEILAKRRFLLTAKKDKTEMYYPALK